MGGASVPLMRGGTSGRGRLAAVGREGEEATARAYRRGGFEILARNWRCPAGELDLVLAGLRQLAELFLASSRLRPEGVRFDVASVGPGRDGPVTVELFEDAF